MNGYAQYEQENKRKTRGHLRTDSTKNFFVNTCILCGTVVVIAITVKVIMSLFV